MGAAANPPQSNPTAQINWMIGYIKSVYGDPIAANRHENMFHWYARGGLVDKATEAAFQIEHHKKALGRNFTDHGQVFDRGGWLPPGKSMVWNQTGKPEHLTPSNGTDLERKFDKMIALTCQHIELTRRLINTTAAVPQGVGNHVGGALNGAASQASFRQRYHNAGA